MVEVRPRHVFALLTLFWAMWLYTEVSEYISRQEQIDSLKRHIEDIEEFKKKGDRFTADDGQALENRIERLEKEIEQHD